MGGARRLKKDFKIAFLYWVGVPVIVGYLISMFLVPAIISGFSWQYIQGVWHHWQALNVGFLALSSSLLALYISRSNMKARERREFLAARAFLPESLSELSDYFERSAIFLKDSWELVHSQTSGHREPLDTHLPELPAGYRSTFSRCISLADSGVSQYLTYVLVKLQIHQARMTSLKQCLGPNSDGVLRSTTTHEIVSYMASLAELQALANRIFEYARGVDYFHDASLVWDDFRTAYANLSIFPELVRGLEEHTKRLIDSGAFWREGASSDFHLG